MLVINTLFYFQYKYEKEYVAKNAFKNFHESEQILRMSRQERLPFHKAKKRLNDILGIEMLKKEQAGNFIDGKLLGVERDIRIYSYEGKVYMHLNDRRRRHEIFLRYEDEKLHSKNILIFALLINLSVGLFFLYVIRRIWPLRKLKTSIEGFSRGKLDIDTKVDAKDEIAQVSNEFDKAIGTIKKLQESRNLFLRNIMHELKTPIAKGKIITDLINDEKNANRLSLIFNRFEYLLGEFAKIERVTSNEMDLNIKKFRVVDIVDNALDILMVEKDLINIKIESESEIDVDFELFSVAIKNLIDNALKYGVNKPSLQIKADSICIISDGKKLDNALFNQVFNRKFEDSSKGLGLGLYITKNIIQKHGFKLECTHLDGHNYFCIIFSNDS